MENVMNEALWALGGTVLGATLTTLSSWWIQSRQFRHEERMHALLNQSRESVKAILLEMLNHKSHTDRSFFAIRERVGGFDDDEIRQILHEIGARRVSRNGGTEEWWYLDSRRQERIDNKRRKAALRRDKKGDVVRSDTELRSDS
jgi:hypothetical protein